MAKTEFLTASRTPKGALSVKATPEGSNPPTRDEIEYMLMELTRREKENPDAIWAITRRRYENA